MTNEDPDSDAPREDAHMVEPPSHPETGDDTGAGSGRRSRGDRPRRVYVMWAAGIALVVLFVALHLTGTIGPGSH